VSDRSDLADGSQQHEEYRQRLGFAGKIGLNCSSATAELEDGLTNIKNIWSSSTLEMSMCP